MRSGDGWKSPFTQPLTVCRETPSCRASSAQPATEQLDVSAGHLENEPDPLVRARPWHRWATRTRRPTERQHAAVAHAAPLPRRRRITVTEVTCRVRSAAAVSASAQPGSVPLFPSEFPAASLSDRGSSDSAAEVRTGFATGSEPAYSGRTKCRIRDEPEPEGWR